MEEPSSPANRPRRRDAIRKDRRPGQSRVAAAIDAARKYLFSQQHEEGYWCGELGADTTLESDYILLHTLLGTGNASAHLRSARATF